MPHRFADRVRNYPIFDEVGLDRFNWQLQPGLEKTVTKWLVQVCHRLFFGGERSANILAIWGDNGLGKTMLATSIAKYHMLNLACRKFEFIPWNAYIQDKLDNGGEAIKPDWFGSELILIDDFDGRTPIPKSLDTWLVDQLTGIIKTRSSVKYFPTILTSNRDPYEIEAFFSYSSMGQFNEQTLQAARTLQDAIRRQLWGVIHLTKDHVPKKPDSIDRAEHVKSFLCKPKTYRKPFEIWERKGGSTLWEALDEPWKPGRW